MVWVSVGCWGYALMICSGGRCLSAHFFHEFCREWSIKYEIRRGVSYFRIWLYHPSSGVEIEVARMLMTYL